jgi:hypothetical protein
MLVDQQVFLLKTLQTGGGCRQYDAAHKAQSGRKQD